MRKTVLFLTLLLLIISQSFGQFTLKGDFRPRFEFRGGYGQMLDKDQDPVLTISERARLSAYYQNGIFTFGIGFQDVRVWGVDNTVAYTGTPIANSKTELNEGWIGIKPYTSGLFKIGRQYWAYEDERMLSIRSWNQSEVKYDAFLFQHNSKAIQVDVGLSWNNLIERTNGNEYASKSMKTLNFLYLKKKINDNMYVSALAIASGFTQSDTTSVIYLQGTYGLYFSYKKGNWNVLADGYYQNGRNRKGFVTNAYLLSARADYLFAKKFTVGAGIDYISGTDQKTDDADYKAKNHTFDNLYGVRHRVLGHLDYFNNIPNSTWNGGIADFFLKFNYAFVSNASAGVDLHYMSLQNNVLDKTSETGDEFLTKGLGGEIDAYFSWDIVKFVNVRGGYSTFLATNSMEKIQGVYGNARFPSWIWIMITAKPVFLDTAAK